MLCVGHLAEFGLIEAQGLHKVAKLMAIVLDEEAGVYRILPARLPHGGGLGALVPFAKERLSVDDGALDFLPPCLGMGAVAAMLLAGLLNACYGSKSVNLIAGFSFAPILRWW